jgi:hypothetical protein
MFRPRPSSGSLHMSLAIVTFIKSIKVRRYGLCGCVAACYIKWCVCCVLCRVCFDYMKQDHTSRACSGAFIRYERDKKCIHNFILKTWLEETTLEVKAQEKREHHSWLDSYVSEQRPVASCCVKGKEHPHSMIGEEFFDCVCTKIHWRIRNIYHHHSKSKRRVKIVFVYSKKV